MRHCGGALARAALCTFGLNSARADQTIGANFNLPVHVNCHGRLIFRNNVKGTHTAEATSSVTLLPDGPGIEIPKSPHQGGSGGNPLIYIQFLQSSGDPIGTPFFLRHCNQL